MSEGQILSRGPSRVVTEGTTNDDNTEIQIALISYFKSHGFNILKPTVNQLLTNIMKHKMIDETSESETNTDKYIKDLENIVRDIVGAHIDCKLVTELQKLLLPTPFPPSLDIIKQLELFISLMLIITIIYDKSVLHLLIAGPLFSYQNGKKHSTKIRDGIGKERPWFRCNEDLLNLEKTLQVVDALYQWRNMIESGKEITEDDIARVLKYLETPKESRDTITKVIQLCTNGEMFDNFDVDSVSFENPLNEIDELDESDEPASEGGGIKKRKRTQRKKTKRKKTKRKKTRRNKTRRKKTRRKKTNRKKQKESKKSVKIGGASQDKEIFDGSEMELSKKQEILVGLICCLFLGAWWVGGWVF